MDIEKPRTILIIDDSPEYLGFMQSLLKQEGFEVSTLPSADSLMSNVARVSPDIIIADVRLPGFAPFAVVDALQADSRTASIPILLCTGAINEFSAGREAPERNLLVLAKPFDVETLLSRIAALLPPLTSVPSA